MKQAICSIMAGLIILTLATGVSGQPLKVITEDYVPFNYMENNQVKGFTTEIVKKLIEMTNIKIENDQIHLWP